jgi:hypothetical protein
MPRSPVTHPSDANDPKRSSTRPKSRIAARLDPLQRGMLPGNPWLGQQMRFDRLKRRAFLTLLGGAAVAWPLVARAQQTKRIFKVGHLESGLPSSSPYLLAAFQQGLGKLGYIEGENLFIERRYAEGLEERLPQLAAELVRFGVDVIFAIGPPQPLLPRGRQAQSLLFLSAAATLSR